MQGMSTYLAYTHRRGSHLVTAVLILLAIILQPLQAATGVPPSDLKHSNGTVMVDGIYGIPRSGKFTWRETGGSTLSNVELIDTATGAVILSRTQAATPELSYSGLKASHWYRIRVRNYTANDDPWLSVRFNTGPMPVPVITDEPDDVVLEEGQAANFAVAATGDSIGFYWKLNGVDVGGNSPALSLPAGSFLSGQTVTVTAANPAGFDVSRSALITVLPRHITITDHLDNLTVYEGDSATFTVAFAGVADSISWKLPGVIQIAVVTGGSSPASRTIQNVTQENNGPVEVTVSNSRGSHTSSASLTVLPRPVAITNPPAPVTATEGSPASFSVNYSGSATSVRWWIGSREISAPHTGAGPARMSLGAVNINDGGPVTVRVYNSTNPAGAFADTTLTVLPAPPVITLQPLDIVEEFGKPLVLNAGASGHAVTWQWYCNGLPVQGSTAASLVLNGVQAGLYDFQASVSNSGGTVWTDMVFVEIVPRGKLPMPAAASPELSVRIARTGTLIRWYELNTASVPWLLETSASLGSWTPYTGTPRPNGSLRRVLLPQAQRGFYRLTR